MHIILGGTGNVGSSVAESLLKKDEDVTVVSRDEKKIPEWERKGAKVEIVDVLETNKLREVFKKGKQAFLLNPPGDISGSPIRGMTTLDEYVKNLVSKSRLLD